MNYKVPTILGLLLTAQQIESITFVYNLRVRRSFEIGEKNTQESKKFWNATIVPFIQSRDFRVQDEDVDKKKTV